MSDQETYGRIVLQLIPQVRSLSNRGLAGWAILVGGGVVAVLAIMTLASPLISPHDPVAINTGPILSPPSGQFPLGTNHLGQDMLSRVISGGTNMFQVSILSVIMCLIVGVPVGLFASYKGGLIDKFASLVMDSIYAFPGLVLAIAIAATLGPGVVNMAVSIAVVYVPSYFRIIRSQVLTIKQLPYVDAARMIGASTWTTLLDYVLPNIIPSIVAVATMNFADAILTAGGTYLRWARDIRLCGGLGLGSYVRQTASHKWSMVGHYVPGAYGNSTSVRLHASRRRSERIFQPAGSKSERSSQCYCRR